MTSGYDQLNFAVEIRPDDATRAARLTGPAVDDWPESARVIWRVPYDADRARLQSELILLAKNILEKRADVLHRYVFGARIYWHTSQSIYKLNRQKLADALESWRATVYEALLSPNSTFDTLAELAECAPSIEIKAEEEDMLPLALLPVGVAGAGMERGLTGLVKDALTLPAFLGPVRYVPWGDDSGQPVPFSSETVLSSGASRHSLLLRSEDTKLWSVIEASLARSKKGSLVTTAPRLGMADTPGLLASSLVMPEPIQGIDGYAATPSEIYVYAHGVPGEAFSNSLTVHFEFSSGRGFLGSKKRASWDLERYHIGQAVDYAKLQTQSGPRPFILFSVCYSAGDVGEETASVPIELVEYGCRVIAPRTRVTEGFAGQFLEALQGSMEICSTPGRALLAARWVTLKDLRSPLSLVYSGFGI
jgi:hypothetical protein